MLIEPPFHPKARIALRIVDGDVRLALARNGKADVFERGDEARSVVNVADLDALLDIGVYGLAGAAALQGFLWPLEHTSAIRIVRTGPAVFVVQRVPKRRVERGPAGRRDVQRLAGRKLHARRHEMQFDPAAFGVRVPHPEAVILIGFEAGEGDALEFVHDLLLLGRARGVLAGERDDAARIAPLPIDAVDQLHRALGIAAQDLGRLMFAARLARDIADRAGSIAAAMREELDQHGAPSPDGSASGGRVPSLSASDAPSRAERGACASRMASISRSISISRAITARASTAFLSRLAQRAS